MFRGLDPLVSHIPVNFIVYSSLLYNGTAFRGLVNSIFKSPKKYKPATRYFFTKDHNVPIFLSADGVNALAGVILQYNLIDDH